MLALVTGGGGFLGREIVRQLLARGDRVRVLSRQAYPDLAALGVECHLGDLRDYLAVANACAGVEVVFHTAALAGFWGPREAFLATNTRGTANVIRACLEAKVGRLVYTSSPSVVFDVRHPDIEGGTEALPYPPTYASAYSESKARAEQMVLEANGWEMSVERPGEAPRIERFTTCALRPHLLWGPGDPHLVPRLLSQARRGRLRIIGRGDNRVSLTHVANAAQAHLLACDALATSTAAAGQAYFVCDAIPVRLWDWINQLLEGVGVPPVRRHLSLPAARFLAAGWESLHRLLPGLGEPPLTRFVVAHLAASHWFDCSKARYDLGYQPCIGGDAGLRELAAWLRREA